MRRVISRRLWARPSGNESVYDSWPGSWGVGLDGEGEPRRGFSGYSLSVSMQ